MLLTINGVAAGDAQHRLTGTRSVGSAPIWREVSLSGFRQISAHCRLRPARAPAQPAFPALRDEPADQSDIGAKAFNR